MRKPLLEMDVLVLPSVGGLVVRGVASFVVVPVKWLMHKSASSAPCQS